MSMLERAPMRSILGCGWFGGAAELEDGRHVDGIDDFGSKDMSGGAFHARVGGADGSVEALGGLCW